MNMFLSIRQMRSAALTLPLVLLAAGCASTPEFNTSGLAKVVKLTGGARASDDGRTWRMLHVGEGLNVGTTVQTAVSSSLEIQAGDIRRSESGGDEDTSTSRQHNRLLFAQDSIVQIEALPVSTPGAYSGDGDIRLRLQSGGVMCYGTATGESPLCEIQFAHGVVRARGATVVVQNDGLVRVLRGAASFQRADGTGRGIAEGSQFNAQTGQLSKISGTAQTEAQRMGGSPGDAPKTQALPTRLEATPPPRKY